MAGSLADAALVDRHRDDAGRQGVLGIAQQHGDAEAVGRARRPRRAPPGRDRRRGTTPSDFSVVTPVGRDVCAASASSAAIFGRAAALVEHQPARSRMLVKARSASLPFCRGHLAEQRRLLRAGHVQGRARTRARPRRPRPGCGRARCAPAAARPAAAPRPGACRRSPWSAGSCRRAAAGFGLGLSWRLPAGRVRRRSAARSDAIWWAANRLPKPI